MEKSTDAIFSQSHINPPEYQSLRFHGKGGEYFGIWIVNLLLTIVTLGIYSAWATVRTRKYFYGNTEIAGSALDFHGDPKAILLGRIIAIVLLGLYVYGSYVHFYVPVVVMLLVILAYPWFYVKSWRFRLRNTSWRGIYFDFRADAGYFYRRLLAYFLVLAVLLGGFYYMAANGMSGWQAGLLFFAFIIGLWSLAPMIYAELINGALHHSYLGDSRFDLGLQKGPWVGLFWKTVGVYILVAIAIGIVSAVVYGIAAGVGAFDADNEPWLMIAGAYVGMFLVYLVPYAYWQIRKLNMIFAHLQIKDVHFSSNMHVMPFAKLLFVNSLLTIITLGLAYPWAAVRMARYQIEHVRVRGNFDSFVGSTQQESNALGDEVASAFDMEIGL